MGVISMRELLRAPKKAFERVDAGETCLITRDGHPVASLVPVVEEAAEAALVAASPQLAKDRQEAAHARAEGRTTPIEEVSEQLGVGSADLGDEQLERDTVVAPLAYFPSRHALRRVEILNETLVKELLDVASPAAALAHEAVGAATPAQPESLSAEWALKQVTDLNHEVVEIGREFGSEPPSIYEAYVMGGIGVIERLRHIHGGSSEGEGDMLAWLDAVSPSQGSSSE
jgi:antitoxin (DNA-binding transcriptional repressor) of toxin-antitoxin stability system